MKIRERIVQMIEAKKAETRAGGPNPDYKMGAEAEIIVRGPDGQIKSKSVATHTEITL